MSEWLIVNAELLGAVMNCEKCPAINSCTGMLSGRMNYESDSVCVAKLIEHSDGQCQPLPSSAQFAGEMEELLRVAVSPFDGMEQSELAAKCFQVYGRQGQKMAGFVLETRHILADIAAAKEASQ